MAYSGPEDTSLLNVLLANPTLQPIPGSTNLDLDAAIRIIDPGFVGLPQLVFVDRPNGVALPWTITPGGTLYPWLDPDDQPTYEDGLIAQKFATVDDLGWSYSQRTLCAHHRATATNTLLRELLLLADAIPRTLNNLEATSLH